jgi:hypothetical protein
LNFISFFPLISLEFCVSPSKTLDQPFQIFFFIFGPYHFDYHFFLEQAITLQIFFNFTIIIF